MPGRAGQTATDGKELPVETKKKSLLVIYHSQGGTMERMAQRFARGAALEPAVAVVLKKAGEAQGERMKIIK